MNNKEKLNALLKIGATLSPLYSTIMSLRADFYKKGLLNVFSVKIPVISIGNITMGGTGKTPFEMTIAREFINKGIKTAIISRGYGGKSKKWPLVISDGKNIYASTKNAGDEAVLIAHALPDSIIVSGPDRFADAQVCEKMGCQVIIMDDGFQHIRLKRNLDILLIDSNTNIFKERVFPGGYLREPLHAINRAHCIILTKTELLSQTQKNEKINEIKNFLENKDIPVFYSENIIKKFIDFNGNFLKLTELINKKAFCFTGIAKPDNFFNTLEKLKINIKRKIPFWDHYAYNINDIKNIVFDAQKENVEFIVTTQKDMVKIHELFKNSDKELKNIFDMNKILYLEIETIPQEEFWIFLFKKIHLIKQ